MKKYLVEIFTDSDGYGLAWEPAGVFDNEDDARAYADEWRKESPEVAHRIVRREFVAEYRGGDRRLRLGDTMTDLTDEQRAAWTSLVDYYPSAASKVAPLLPSELTNPQPSVVERPQITREGIEIAFESASSEIEGLDAIFRLVNGAEQ